MKSIGDIIRTHRLDKNMTQEELGKLVFVSKQAVSKWETGKTMPDLEMIRKLCEILDISKDEILGGSVEETKRNRRWLKISIVAAVLSLLVALFFVFDGVGYVQRHTQSGVAYITVFENGELLDSSCYSVVTKLPTTDMKNGYKINIGYGDVQGIVKVANAYEIEYGFINTNNWHNVHIMLEFEEKGRDIYACQTISYETDGEKLEILKNESIGAEGETISVFREGV